MKLLLLFIFSFYTSFLTFGQTTLVNLKSGTWKTAQTWLYERVPVDSEDVVLLQDIVIDTNAFCRSLTTNGYNITVVTGFHLKIAGQDTAGLVSDNDTLVSELTNVYYGDGSISGITTTWNRRYEYDSLKRINKVLVNTVGDNRLSVGETTFFYSGSNPNPYKSLYSCPCEFSWENLCYGRYDTVYYEYNIDGFVIRDSLNWMLAKDSLLYRRAQKYIITGDSVIRYRFTNSYVISYPGGVKTIRERLNYDTTYYNLVGNFGNIVKQTDSSKLSSSIHFSRYDGKKNPLYQTSIHQPVLPFEQLIFEDPEQRSNTLLHNQKYVSEGYLRQREYRSVFRYRANNYPSERILLDSSDKKFLTILKYKYIK